MLTFSWSFAQAIRASSTVFEVENIYYDPARKGVGKYVKGIIPHDVDLTNNEVAKQILEEGTRFALEETRHPNPHPGHPIDYVVIMLYWKGKHSMSGPVVRGRSELEKGKEIKRVSVLYNHAEKIKLIERKKAEQEEKRRKILEEQQKKKEARKAKEEKERAEVEKRLLAFGNKNGVKEWVALEKLCTNPFVYEGKTVGIAVNFFQMLSATQGFFIGKFGRAIVVSDVPRGLFKSEASVVLAGRVLGNIEPKLPFAGTMMVPHLKFVGVHICKYSDCRDIIPTEKKTR